MEKGIHLISSDADISDVGASAYVKTKWAHELIAQRAQATPEATAVSSGEQRITFLELERRANRLARHLQTLGAATEVPIGLYFERSIDFVVAALAVLKTGGAYVPLDAAYPPARIDAILRDAGVPVLVSHQWMAASLPGGPWKTVDLGFDARTIDSHSSASLDVQVAGRDLAYIVYTSGSTGQPKGVEVTHANLQHLIEWHQRAFLITPLDRASQVAGLAFDAAVWEIWCHLAAGASLHLIDEASRRSPEALQQWLVACAITVAFVPTILAEYLISFDWPKNAALRILLTGADTLRRYPKPGLPFTLINNYGPTECTVLVTSGAVRGGMDGEQLPSIGNPIADTDILILNTQMNEAGKGDEGEICVAGPQVARGYHNLPLLTAERFVYANGRRVYRTGDLGRVLPDGQIAFAGRMDDQIKIRGFRIEPDEVAAHLNGHPGIRNSVVTFRADDAGEKTLAGYIVPMPGATLTSTELREHLRLHLPEYMIPAVFVSVSALPVTTTGKCDRQALPVPSAANLLRESLEDERKEQATQSETEMRIAELVSGLMDGKPISRDDNFFLVGGHSLMAAQLIARVRESMAVSLNLRQLFEAPTIGSLAAVVEQKLAAL